MLNRTRSKTLLKRSALILILTALWHAVTPATEDSTLLDYFVKDLNFQDPALEAQWIPVLNHLDQRKHAEAERALKAFLARNANSLEPEYPVLLARLRTNLGILQAVQDNDEEALLTLQDAVDAMQKQTGRFDARLVKPLRARGKIYTALGAYKEAEDDLRWAQNIVHRHDGVYSPEQLPVVKQLAYIHVKQEKMTAVDRDQRFYLEINERRYGSKSEEMVPVLQGMGQYFAFRGDMIPLGAYQDQEDSLYRDELFREAISYYERAIAILENKYGENDLRLVEPLRGLARTRILQLTAQHLAEDAMERASSIVNNSPQSDLADQARALVELADTYVITSDNRAEETYLKAWNLLADKPQYKALRNKLFGTPKRLYPENPGVLVLERYPHGIDEDDPLYVNAEFSVRANGRVSDVEIIDGNVPNEEKRAVRYHLAEARYRPRIVDGEFRETSGLMLHQPFRVEKPEPKRSISVSSGPTY